MLGATSLNDITRLAHHAPVPGAEPSDTTVRRTLERADPRPLDKAAWVRAAVRARLVADPATPAGFPWLAVAGKILRDWLPDHPVTVGPPGGGASRALRVAWPASDAKTTRGPYWI